MTRLGFAKVLKFPKTASFVLVRWQGISGLAILPRPQHPSENQHRTWKLVISKFGISCIPGRTPPIFRFHVSFWGAQESRVFSSVGGAWPFLWSILKRLGSSISSCFHQRSRPTCDGMPACLFLFRVMKHEEWWMVCMVCNYYTFIYIKYIYMENIRYCYQ